MTTDERTQRRHSVRSYLKATYRDTGIELGRVSDLSKGGMRLCSHLPIQTDRALAIKLTFQDGSILQNSTIFRVNVIWCARAKNDDLYYTGVKFLDQDRKRAEIIDRLIETAVVEDHWVPIMGNMDF